MYHITLHFRYCCTYKHLERQVKSINHLDKETKARRREVTIQYYMGVTDPYLTKLKSTPRPSAKERFLSAALQATPPAVPGELLLVPPGSGDRTAPVTTIHRTTANL